MTTTIKPQKSAVQDFFLFKPAGITSEEITDWQDQIIHLKNVRKNWQGKKRKSKKDCANWKKTLTQPRKPRNILTRKPQNRLRMRKFNQR